VEKKEKSLSLFDVKIPACPLKANEFQLEK